MGVLTKAEQTVLADLCTHLVVMDRAKEEFDKLPDLFVSDPDSGRTMRNPFLSLIQDETAVINTLRRELGLTPSARSRIQIASKDDQKNRGGLLNGEWKSA